MMDLNLSPIGKRLRKVGEWANTKIREAETFKAKETSYCSFCGKSQHQVLKLIAGPGPRLFICNECVDLCAAICAGTADERDRREETMLMAAERRDREFGKIRDVLADVQREIERLWLARRRDSSGQLDRS